jgi:hypothetical protein
MEVKLSWCVDPTWLRPKVGVRVTTLVDATLKDFVFQQFLGGCNPNALVHTAACVFSSLLEYLEKQMETICYLHYE